MPPAPDSTGQPDPVFIVALPKSYTSVLSGMLGQHPGLRGMPELNLFVGETVLDWAMQPAHGIMCDGLLRSVAQMLHGEQTEQTVALALAWLQTRADRKVSEVFDALRHWAAPAALIDQSPVYSRKPAYLQRILRLYPGARFIHMTRNPVTWLGSMAKWGPAGQAVLQMYRETEVGPEAMQDPIALWQLVHEGIGNMLGSLGPDRYIRVMGEDCVTRTDEVLVRLLTWLGLSHDESVLAAMHHPEDSDFAFWGPPGARGGNNPDFLTSPVLRRRSDRDALLRMDLGLVHVSLAAQAFARDLGYR